MRSGIRKRTRFPLCSFSSSLLGAAGLGLGWGATTTTLLKGTLTSICEDKKHTNSWHTIYNTRDSYSQPRRAPRARCLPAAPSEPPHHHSSHLPMAASANRSLHCKGTRRLPTQVTTQNHSHCRARQLRGQKTLQVPLQRPEHTRECPGAWGLHGMKSLRWSQGRLQPAAGRPHQRTPAAHLGLPLADQQGPCSFSAPLEYKFLPWLF